MRDIIFRAKAISTNEWVYGSLIKQLVEDWIEYSIIDKDGYTYIIHEQTIGQYTGLKDNKRTKEFPDGQEIYEGDIVRFLDDMRYIVSKEKEYLVGEVKFIDGAFWCFYEDEENLTRLVSVMVDYWGGELKGNQCEIINNIKENPELLEKRK